MIVRDDVPAPAAPPRRSGATLANGGHTTTLGGRPSLFPFCVMLPGQSVDIPMDLRVKALASLSARRAKRPDEEWVHDKAIVDGQQVTRVWRVK